MNLSNSACNPTALLFLGLTVQDSVNLPPITLACLPLHETGLPLWSCTLALCHHVYCLPGAVWSLLALVLSQDLMPFVHSTDVQPFALS